MSRPVFNAANRNKTIIQRINYIENALKLAYLHTAINIYDDWLSLNA